MSTFPTSVYTTRIERLRAQLSEQEIAAVVLTSGVDLQYLVGTELQSHERLSAVIVTAESAHVIVPTVERGEVIRAQLAQIGFEITYWVDGDTPHQLVADDLPAADKGPVAVGAECPAGHLLPLMTLSEGHNFVNAAPVMASLIARKDDAEQEALAGAAAAIDRVHAQVPQLLRAGRTEREVADDIRELILREHSGVDFIIVGSGPNGANAHHDFSDRQLCDGDIVVVDIGGTYGPGYHSDCTRTYVLGAASAQQQEAYEVLYRAQQAAREAVRPGVTAAHIDAVARDTLAAAGLGEAFIHRTGHGIGLSTHEEPFIMPGNEVVLAPGMVFSIEPGIYFSDSWGARIEDIVMVTEEGYQALNQQPRELTAAQ